MKNLSYILLSFGILLTPAFALAEDAGVSVSAETNIKTEKPRPLMAPAPIREMIRGIASTTRAEVRGDVQDARSAIKGMVVDRVEKLKTIMGSSTPQERQQFREDSRTAIEEKRAEASSTIATARQQARTKFGETVQTSVNNITDHLTQSASALASIADRIDARITELQGQGHDMTNSITLLIAARADISAAQDNIATVGTALASALASATPKEQFAPVRTAIVDAESALKVAKKSLQATLQSVRVEGAATTSVSAQ